MRKNILIFIASIAVIFLGAIIASSFWSFESTSVVVPSHQAVFTEATTTLPETLIIPKLNIKASIEDVGVTADGNMATPEKSADVGWYKYGTIPGQMGNAVIAGHLDDFLGLPAIFTKLSTLSPGDDIYVSMQDGTTLHFVVTDTKKYPYDGDTSEVFESSAGAHLNLITCNGNWLTNVKNYDTRFVVFADLVTSETLQ